MNILSEAIMKANQKMESKYDAKKEDGKVLSRLLESPADTGLIRAIYTRRPDAYESYMKESGEPRVFAFRDDGKIIATCAEITRELYVGGEVRRSGYICGLKRDPDHKGYIRAGSDFFDTLLQPDIDFYYCTVVTENKKAGQIFNKRRKQISFELISSCTTYIMNPKVKIKEDSNQCVFRQATEGDSAAVLEFLNREGRKKDLFPVIRAFDDYYDLSIENFYILLDGNEIVACAALWDVSSYKQYTVMEYKGITKLARRLNFLLSLLGYVKLPKENEPLKFPMISFFLSKDDNEEYYKIFFSRIKDEIKKTCQIFVITLPKNHFAVPLLKKLPKITLDSDIYRVRFSAQKDKVSIDPSNIFTESALL